MTVAKKRDLFGQDVWTVMSGLKKEDLELLLESIENRSFPTMSYTFSLDFCPSFKEEQGKRVVEAHERLNEKLIWTPEEILALKETLQGRLLTARPSTPTHL